MFTNEFIMHRHPANPLIKPSDFPIPADTVTNCGQVMFEGKTLLLLAVVYRGKYKGQASGMHVATSTDGVHFEIEKEPFIRKVTKKEWFPEYDNWVIDPRVTKIEDTYYICRPAQMPGGPAVLLEKTNDWKTKTFVDCISMPSNRVSCLFPEKIDGYYYRLDRPYNMGAPRENGTIWIARSPDLLHWGHFQPILFPYGPFFGEKVGPTPPIKTKDGWLVIIHGVWKSCADSRYSLSAMLLDLEDPTKVVGKMDSWILTPDQPYELTGHVANVVFACGAIADEESDSIRIYYGAADTSVCLAEGRLSELIDACKNNL